MPSSIIAGLRHAVSRALGRSYVPPEESAYRRLYTKGFRPTQIIDVGAYRGDWTRLARRVFPQTPVLMIEAQDTKRPDLETVCRELTDVRYVQALLGRSSGETKRFFAMETGSSMFAENSNAPRTATELVTSTLDHVAGTVPSDTLLKIDVQGAELEVLEGGPRTLASCEVVQLEVAILPYNDGAPTALEVLSYMAERDFAPFDISGFSRPNGIDLAQIDLLFTRSSSTLRNRFFTF
jgi:FkbM family methyltransferase